MDVNEFIVRRKQEKKIVARKRLGRFLIIVIVWFFVALYFLTPLSKVATPKVNGNIYFSKQTIIEYSALNYQKNTYIWDIDADTHKNALIASNALLIKNIDIKKSFLGVSINFEEIYPIGKINDNYLFSDGNIFSENMLDSIIFAHLKNYQENDIFTLTPEIIGEYEGIAPYLKSCDPFLLNNFIKTITLSNHIILQVSDYRIDKTVYIHFIQLKELAIFLQQQFYQNSIATFNQNSEIDYYFLNGNLGHYD